MRSQVHSDDDIEITGKKRCDTMIHTHEIVASNGRRDLAQVGTMTVSKDRMIFRQDGISDATPTSSPRNLPHRPLPVVPLDGT